MELFSQFRVPLNLAVVPAWLTRIRWQNIMSAGKFVDELWCWHQHGRRGAARYRRERAEAGSLGQVRNGRAEVPGLVANT